tara:strand:- start:6027 stop:6584 length:558 start_codon:yes stop_codon:yes gene_type:complete
MKSILVVLVSSLIVSGTPAAKRGISSPAAIDSMVTAAGVPINPYATAFYSMQGAGYRPPIVLSDSQLNRLAEKVYRLIETRPTADSPQNLLVKRHCVACHSGNSPEGKFDVTSELNDSARLKMIARVVNPDPKKRMPQKSTLSPTVVGALIRELSSHKDKDVDVTGGTDAASELPKLETERPSND